MTTNNPQYWRDVAARLRAAVAASEAARTQAQPTALKVLKGGKA